MATMKQISAPSRSQQDETGYPPGYARTREGVDVAVCWAVTVRRDLTLPFIIDRIA
jgi:hypothetical protein